MRSYSFPYVKGSSRPYGHIEARDDADFLRQLPGWLKEHDGTIAPGEKATWLDSGEVAINLAGTYWPISEETKREINEIEHHLGGPPGGWNVGQMADGGEYLMKA